MDLKHHRQEYRGDPLELECMAQCPAAQFETWYQSARHHEITEPNAMSLATVDPEGCPSSRTVLLKYFDTNGFVFYTNYRSRKAIHMASNTNVALLFQWLDMARQVEINGTAEKVALSESIKYFASRPRNSQLGAWVSDQSSVVKTRDVLTNKLSELVRKFAAGSIPKPEQWGGYRVIPERFEFWQGGSSRIHDRIEYQLDSKSNAWNKQRLSP